MVDRPPWSPDVVPFSRIGAGKPPFWASKDAAALERVNIVSDTFSGAWRRVTSSMEVFPPYNGRSGGDLSIGGGLGPSRCLERRFRRSWWLGCAWWRVGN
uniref:Uncharacterized protein n=1 Tax=Fagus sylvatica TaxID=28930 RepID=A0A2N9HVQ8_FAGSY